MAHHRLGLGPRGLSRERAEEWARAIAKELGYGAPRVNWTPRAKNGHYCAGVINVGPRCWRGAADCLLHEVAHHVDWRGRGHGETFYLALLRVADSAGRLYGHEYDWLTEYKTVRVRRLTDRTLIQAAGPREGAR